MCVLDGKEEEHVYENTGNVNQAFEGERSILVSFCHIGRHKVFIYPLKIDQNSSFPIH